MKPAFPAIGGRWNTEMARKRAGKHDDDVPEISLRPAQANDYQFAVDLYLESTKRLLLALDTWNEDEVIARFRSAFKPDQAQVVQSNGADIGWMQVSEASAGFHLHQIHIVATFRNRGVGSRLILDLLGRARAEGRPLVLNVIRGNPALSLYRRLGFRRIGETHERIQMIWDPAKARHRRARPGPRRRAAPPRERE